MGVPITIIPLTNVIALETYRSARLLIETGWTQNEWSRDAAGNKVSFYAEECTCFCLVGAIKRARGDGDVYVLEHELLRPVAHLVRPDAVGMMGDTRWADCIIGWNDEPGRTKAQVLDVLDQLIAMAEAGTLLPV